MNPPPTPLFAGKSDGTIPARRVLHRGTNELPPLAGDDKPDGAAHRPLACSGVEKITARAWDTSSMPQARALVSEIRAAMPGGFMLSPRYPYPPKT